VARLYEQILIYLYLTSEMLRSALRRRNLSAQSVRNSKHGRTSP
jgi:hypothetical protein